MSDNELPALVRMIGGELPTWSDLGSAWEPARRGVQIPILSPVLGSRSRVLVAGPHEPDLIVALADAGAGRLTCLVRSVPDARVLAEALERTGVRIVCGSLERYDETGYDAVVALDGIGRLYSTEGPEATFAAALADLRRLSTPDAVLAVMVHNELGLHRLTAPVRPEADHSEPAFARPPGADDTLPGNLAELTALWGAGAAIWPVYPLPGAPAVGWGPAAGSVDPAEYGGLFAALCAGPARTLALRNPAADASLLLRTIWRSGHLPDLAPGWLVVAGEGAGVADDVVAWTVAAQGEAEVVRLAGTRPVLPDGSDVPAGQLVSDLLLQAVVAPDQAALRSAVRGYANWLAEQSESAPATAGGVVLGPDGIHRLLTIGSAAGPAAKTADEQLLVAIADLVREVESHGYRRTWPSYLTPAEAVGWVAAMRGDPLPADLVQQVAMSAEPAPAAAAVPAVQEVRARFEESNASRARWFETRLQSAEKQLSVAYRELDQVRLQVARAEAEKSRISERLKALQSSRTMRVMRAVRHPLRTGKRVGKRTARRVLKPVVKPIRRR
jgi:hypothetical protein